MQGIIDLTVINDLEDRRAVVRDRLAEARVRPWTPVMVCLADGRSFEGCRPEPCWLVGEPLVDQNGNYLPDLQFLRLEVGPDQVLQTSLRHVQAIHLMSAMGS
jgi:hypothetical protein